MFCTHCGKEIAENAVICPDCGCPTMHYRPPHIPNPANKKSIGFAVLGFFLPFVGLLLYILWRNSLPKKEGSCATGAIINLSLQMLLMAATGMMFLVVYLIY